MTAAGTRLEGLAQRLHRLFMSLAALSFVLQSLAAIGGVSPHSMSHELGASPPSIDCVAQKSNPHSHIPVRAEEPACCLLFGACDCDAARLAFDLDSAFLAELPGFGAMGRGPRPMVDKRGGRPTGWASSWSPRAPPLFS
ncbi:hypothetical protein EDE12_11622 [Methylosinus sp. sav-2]|uniref:hypothetical protein n=1 Tax=unclassified Methylosinus TaxID=2624500 RepID=UPI0004B98D1D|nr:MULTISPECIES: hypothetical protein [unclassified Methylosinus]TDX61146.1 hypothetical protein EDE12_11622 [Methylosinus sp. sav-2]